MTQHACVKAETNPGTLTCILWYRFLNLICYEAPGCLEGSAASHSNRWMLLIMWMFDLFQPVFLLSAKHVSVYGQEGDLRKLACIPPPPPNSVESQGEGSWYEKGPCGLQQSLPCKCHAGNIYKQQGHNWILLYIWKIRPLITKQADVILFSSFFRLISCNH